MKRSHLMIAMLAGSWALIVAAPAAHARSTKRIPLAVASDFDLSQQSSSQSRRRYRLSSQVKQLTFPSGSSGPYWTFSPIIGGPKLEAGALGGGRKGVPRLAHVGLDWNF